MDLLLTLLSISVIIAVNAWHSVLLTSFNGDTKPHTISNHAVETKQLLTMHRIVHSFTSVGLFIFAAAFLWPHGYRSAAILIIAAGVFDILEVITLNKRSSSEILALNYHAITAWMMALCYLLYTTVAIYASGLPDLLVAVVWLSFLALLGYAVYNKFQNFWITQHIYFCFLGLVMATTHIFLLM